MPNDIFNHPSVQQALSAFVETARPGLRQAVTRNADPAVMADPERLAAEITRKGQRLDI